MEEKKVETVEESDKYRLIARAVKREADSYLDALKKLVGVMSITPHIEERIHDAYVEVVGEAYSEVLTYEELAYYDEVISNPMWQDIHDKLAAADSMPELRKRIENIMRGS